MITYFKDKNHKSKKRCEKYKTLNTILESVDTMVIIGATSTSITLSITAIGLIILSKSDGIACTLSLGYKVLSKLIMSKYNEYKKRYERDQQTIKSFDKLYRKSLQDNVIDKTEYEGLCTNFTKYLEEKKWIFFKGSIVNGIPEPILHSFALDQPPGHKIYKQPRVKLFKEVNESVLSLITFYLEDDDHKPVGFNGETISYTCQLIKIE